MPSLRVARGRTTKDEFHFQDVVTIGRAEECEIRVFDEAASRRHAVVRPSPEGYVAEDLGSRNGLFVNGVRVRTCTLRTGDEVSVRGLTLVFLDDGATERPTVVVEEEPLSIQSRIEPATARVAGREEELLGRLATLYRAAGILSGEPARIRRDLVALVEETFAPCRAALVLPDKSIGTHSRSVVRHVRKAREAVLVKEPAVELPRATSIVEERISSVLAAPLGDFGVLYADRTTGAPFEAADLDLMAALAHAATPVLRPAGSIPAPAEASRELLGESPSMVALKGEIVRVAPSSATVLVTGETGTGKELVARALHVGGSRARGPFVAVNCAAFVETLLEAELFGHEKGAFTGADRARPGRFEQAHKGTLFLDEIGELAPGLQAKLLRVLESREFHRVGATKPTRVDVRIVAATNRDLRGGDFREDLYYRLGVVTLVCPPLRERAGDVRLLVEAFRGDRPVSEAALKLLEAYSWPGNVRELKNVCDRCAVLARGDTIEPEDLPLEVRLGRPAADEPGTVRTLKEMERDMVVRALDATNGNRTQAARLLGITYPTLKKKIDEFGV